jgi:hypothetical protein
LDNDSRRKREEAREHGSERPHFEIQSQSFWEKVVGKEDGCERNEGFI